MYEKLQQITELLKQNNLCFLDFTSNAADFANTKEITIYFHFPEITHEIQINSSPAVNSILNLIAFLTEYGLILTWDIKQLISYCRFHHKSQDYKKFKNKLIDLKYISHYLSLNSKKPNNYEAAVSILKTIKNYTSWKEPYFDVLLPIATEVIPFLENKTFYNQETQQKLYSSYQIEDQLNGRLSCLKINENYFLPHSTNDDLKKQLKVKGCCGESHIFLYFDYKNMEASVLQWLSKDEELLKCLQQKDFYDSLSQLISEKYNVPVNRQTGKMVFLPTIYGISAGALSKKLEIKYEDARGAIDVVKKAFNVSEQWLISKMEDEYPADCFGRKRLFEKDEKYLKRNFNIQSPAALICLHKLAEIYKHCRETLVMSIHDGYVFCCRKQDFWKIIAQIKEILEKPIPFAEGLTLKVSCKAGFNLSELKSVKLN